MLWVAQPWFYNATVVPGPAWGLSGHDQQNFHDEHRFPLLGLTSEPEEDDYMEWWEDNDGYEQYAPAGRPDRRSSLLFAQALLRVLKLTISGLIP